MIKSLRILQLALISGIVFLSANGLQGWGWLMLILFLTLDKHE